MIHGVLPTKQSFPNICLTLVNTAANIYSQHMELAVIYAGVDLGIFKHLVAEQEGALALTQIAEKTGASSALLGNESHFPYCVQC